MLSILENVRYSSKSEFWLAIGTFKSYSGFFWTNLYGTLKYKKGSICVLLVFSLMVEQIENAYKIMFSELNNFVLEHDIYFIKNSSLEIIIGLKKSAINMIKNSSFLLFTQIIFFISHKISSDI